MFKNLFKRIKRKRLLKIIKEAKKAYLNGEYGYMCHCFQGVHDKWHSYEDIVKNIPEFKPSTFNLDCDYHGAWWAYDEVELRIKAFNTLIEIYSK